MSKVSEQKALEAYPKDKLTAVEAVNRAKRFGYIQGYDQAMQDIEKQVEESIIEKSNGEVTIEDLVAYNQGLKIGRDLTFQDFMEKAVEHLEPKILSLLSGDKQDTNKFIEDFKNHMKDDIL